uniref:Fibrinogen C-terminal domain-containing protein n=1 Tax=Amphimedon queenslandica TaxID=400682 RepID=A0A1X7TDS2_AMPQE
MSTTSTSAGNSNPNVTTITRAGNCGYNLTNWSDDIVNKVNQSLPDFNAWANDVSQNTFQLFHENNTNFNELDKQILQSTRDSGQKLINIVNTLSNLQDTSTSTAGVVNNILLVTKKLLQNESPTSCKQLERQYQVTQSGYYTLTSGNGSTEYTAYCDTGILCGSRGGWTRLAYMELGSLMPNCPSAFRLYHVGGYYKSCGRPATSSGGCASVIYPSNGVSYSQICGRVLGYQYGSPDAIYQPANSNYSYRNDINSYYVDGVSITRGSPRQHVWTLMAGISEASASSRSCPCNTGSSVSVPSFIGNNYFCDSDNPSNTASPTLYRNNYLWSGNSISCRSLETACCAAPGIPWFHRDYGSNITTDDIEVRVCGDSGTDDEDTPIVYYQIFVK